MKAIIKAVFVVLMFALLIGAFEVPLQGNEAVQDNLQKALNSWSVVKFVSADLCPDGMPGCRSGNSTNGPQGP